MAKTILITGASTGIGRATANHFKDKGWNVAATMRTPDNAEGLETGDTLKLYRLDVLDDASIDAAIADATRDFGQIDVVLNNAGYGAMGPIEAASKEAIERQFSTNVFGLIAVMQKAIERFRAQGGGTIINVSSIGGRITLPLFSLYHGTKWAVEGITESMIFELDQFNIKLKLVEPGAIATDFASRSLDVMSKPGLTAYDDYVGRFMKFMEGSMDSGAAPEMVAEVIYQAATDGSDRLRYLAGKDAKMYWRIRRWFGDNATIKAIRKRLS